MSLTAPGLSMQDQRPSFGDEVQPEIGADHGLPQSRLQREVELVDGLQEGEVRVSSAALQSRLLPSRYFFGQQTRRVGAGGVVPFSRPHPLSRLLVDGYADIHMKKGPPPLRFCCIGGGKCFAIPLTTRRPTNNILPTTRSPFCDSRAPWRCS